MTTQARPSRAVVFAYHNVGVRCLKVLLDFAERSRGTAQPFEVALVVTHADNPNENIWFGNVAQVAREAGIEVISPADPHDPEVMTRLRALAPDFLFSFYYRLMLAPELLALASRGAFNMHGSLLPKYRGRVPVNWAVLHGENEAGATLHAMVAKPDKGAIVDQMAVPILCDDSAQDVFEKVTMAAEIVLHRCLPALLAGEANLHEQDQSQASYFGGRKAEDGRVPLAHTARQVHNLVRAVAPPYPGAFIDLGEPGVLRIYRSRILHVIEPGGPALGIRDPAQLRDNAGLPVRGAGPMLVLRCGDGGLLQVLHAGLSPRGGEEQAINAHNALTLLHCAPQTEFPLGVNP